MSNLSTFPLQGQPYEIDMYIPPDVTVNTDGSIPAADLDKVYQFDTRDDRFLMSFTGMGMPPINYITQHGPEQHGETPLDFRLQKRIIQYVHRHGPACGRDAYWDNRRSIVNALRPNRQAVGTFSPGRLRKIQPDGTTWDIYALIERGPVFVARVPNQWDEWSFTETLRFVCHDPVWFDPARNSASFTIETTGNLIFETTAPLPSEYPLNWQLNEADDIGANPTPFIFSPSTIYDSIAITYPGTFRSYPVITITGPLSGPLIWINLSQHLIELDYDVDPGEVVTIDLSYGVKTIQSSTAGNIIGTLTRRSNLDFYLTPDPTIPGGINTFVVQGSSGVVGTTEVDITWYDRYIGT